MLTAKPLSLTIVAALVSMLTVAPSFAQVMSCDGGTVFCDATGTGDDVVWASDRRTFGDGITGNIDLLTVVLSNGKKGSLVEVHTEMITNTPANGPSFGMFWQVYVNGIRAHPDHFGGLDYQITDQSCITGVGGTTGCAWTGVWYLDLDKHTDLINEPLVVVLNGFVGDSGQPPPLPGGSVVMGAKLIKK